MAVGTIVSVGFDYLYDNNVLNIQGSLDFVGEKIDDGMSWLGDRVKDVGQAMSNLGDAINLMNWA